jgi:hypothetical protein
MTRTRILVCLDIEAGDKRQTQKEDYTRHDFTLWKIELKERVGECERERKRGGERD